MAKRKPKKTGKKEQVKVEKPVEKKEEVKDPILVEKSGRSFRDYLVIIVVSALVSLIVSTRSEWVPVVKKGFNEVISVFEKKVD
jgi:hypothetical protein